MTDPQKFDAEAARLLAAPQSLRERVVGYAGLFTVGLVVVGLVGLAIGLVFTASVRLGIGYTAISFGVVLVLAGGAQGGGFANLGIGEGIGRMVSHANPSFLLDDEASEAPVSRTSRKFGVTIEPTAREDLIGRLRRGLRPERNPTAFWTVVAGVLYTGFGVFLVLS